MTNHNDIQVPDGAIADSEAFEIGRVWLSPSGHVYTSVLIGSWENVPDMPEYGGWARVLAEMAKIVAEVVHPDAVQDQQEFLRRLKYDFQNEI